MAKKKKVIKSNNKLLPNNTLKPAQQLPRPANGSRTVVKHAMASWGGLKFKVSANEVTALTGFDITDTYNDDYNEKGKKIGRELTTFSINVTYLTGAAGGTYRNARSAMQKWRAKLGKSYYLYVGGSKIFNRKCKLLGVNSGGMSFTNYGGMICVDLQLDFKWARTAAEEKAEAKAAKSSGTTSSKSKSSSSKSTGTAKKLASGGYDGGKMSWPLPGHKNISSNYGWRNCPYHGRELHSGIDIPAPNGTPIKAAAAGTVVLSGYNGSYGNCIIISHGKSVWTLYGHASSLVAKKGAKVKAGQTISKVGSTGNSTGPHLHFEVRKGANQHKNAVSPWGYVSK